MSGTSAETQEFIRAALQDSARVQASLATDGLALIARAAERLSAALLGGQKLIWFGNGGSATQSQHMAAEFVGRFSKDRRSLASISLTENMASITAIANDYQYELIFARQLEGLSQPGDVAIGLSTSGSSPNVLAGLKKAKELGLATVGLTGGTGGAMRERCEICIVVPSKETARIQEAHLTIGHILCALVEHAVLSHGPRASCGCQEHA